MEDNRVNENLKNGLVNLIRSIAEKVFRINIKGYPRFWVATMITASVPQDSVGSVYLNGDTSQPPMSFINKSNQTIVTGDECYIISPSGKLTNAFILVKK